MQRASWLRSQVLDTTGQYPPGKPTAHLKIFLYRTDHTDYPRAVFGHTAASVGSSQLEWKRKLRINRSIASAR